MQRRNAEGLSPDEAQSGIGGMAWREPVRGVPQHVPQPLSASPGVAAGHSCVVLKEPGRLAVWEQRAGVMLKPVCLCKTTSIRMGPLQAVRAPAVPGAI